MLHAHESLLCSKLCQHNVDNPSPFTFMNMRDLVRVHQTILARKFIFARGFAWGFSTSTSTYGVLQRGKPGIKLKMKKP